jgi:antirestriction protein ArdC
MARPDRVALTDQERAERRKQEQQLTERAVAQLRSSMGWQRWLTVRAQAGLRRYSLRNQLLIALADCDATRVAGFRAWLALGYCVRRGERSHIRVWARCEPSKKRLQAWQEAGGDPDERPKPFYKLEAVFSQAQVEPLPPPAEPAPLESPIVPLTGDELGWTLDRLDALAGELEVSVEAVALPDGCGGFYDHDRRTIAISSRLGSDNARARTRVHELAHALVRLDRREQDPQLGYAEEELVVESVAFTVCGGLGIDMTGSSVPYLASWAEQAPLATIEATAGLIDRLARRIEGALEREADDRDVAEGTPTPT